MLIVSSALCFWPAGIIHSIRIGNDLPLYAFYALAFYYALRWWRGHATPHLWYASLWASMALLTKSNALAVWGVIGVLFLVHSYRLWQLRREHPLHLRQIRKNFTILTTCFVVTMALNFGDNLWHYLDGTSSDWLLSNVSESINPGLKVENKPVNYLIFDTATFFKNRLLAPGMIALDASIFGILSGARH